jgi:hypothetical protein
LSKGCEVKRETLNLVVSPVIVVNLGEPMPLWWKQAIKANTLKTSVGLRSGVADSIEQHRVNMNEPGWPTSSWRGLNTAEYAGPTVKRRAAKDNGLGWRPG